jgi:hypothetical protein
MYGESRFFSSDIAQLHSVQFRIFGFVDGLPILASGFGIAR